jgi:hypothetical protein
MRAWYVILPVGLVCGFAACGGDDTSTGPGGGATGGTGGSTGGSGGMPDAGGDVSSGGTGGSGGAAGKGGSAGAGTGGGATGGAAGSGGAGGKGGSAGSTSTGGSSGAGGSAGTGGTAGTGGAAGTAGSAGTGGAAGTGGTGGSSGGDAGPSVSVLEYHNNPSRDGVYIDPVITKAAAATMHVDTTFAMATYTGPVFAQPLYLASNGTVPDLVIVGTNQNHIVGFNAATGAKVYDETLGTPVPRANLATLRANCGLANLDPLGIISTPVIDGATRSIYLGSEQLSGSTAKHMVYAIDANTGMTRTGWPVDVGATAKSSNATFNALAEHQRGALALLGGRVIVPYGGHYGDCGDYHGWVVSISTTDPTQVSSFATRAIAGGVWSPGGVAHDGTNVYFSTGNTQAMTNSFTPPAMYGDGNTVFKLPPTLAQTGATTEYFVPTNWSALDQADDDLGGTSPILVDVAGATPSKLIVQFGKDQKAYLINRDTMGGQSAPVAAPTVATNAIVGAGVAYKTAMGTYALFRGPVSGCPSGQSGSMAAIRITAAAPPTAAVAWCGGAASTKSPAVTMTSAAGTDALVWLVGTDNRLRAYDGDTGMVVFNGGAAGDVMTTSSTFITPMVANGRIFVAANAQTYAFRP